MRSRIFILLLICSQFVWGQDTLPGWDYLREVTIYNPTAESLTDIQVRFILDTRMLVDSAKLDNDGTDIRVTDASLNVLPFYGREFDIDSANTIWVKIPNLPANDSVKLNLYYGNDTASSALNGDGTFLFFDDFGIADSVDPAKWETIGSFAQFRVNNGRLEYASNGMNPGPRFKFCRTKISFDRELDFDFKVQVSNANGFGFSSLDDTLTRIIFRQSGFGFDTLNQVAYNEDTVTNGTSISQEYPLIRFERGEPTNGNIRAGIENDLLTLYKFSNTEIPSAAADTFQVDRSTMTGFHFILSSFINFSIYLDYLWVREPLPEEITWALGPEQLIRDTMTVPTDTTGNPTDTTGNPTSILTQTQLTGVKLYPNPAVDFVNLEGIPAGDIQLQLLDEMGRKVWEVPQLSVFEQAIQLNLPSLSSGMYWIVVRHPQNGVFTQSLQIE